MLSSHWCFFPLSTPGLVLHTLVLPLSSLSCVQGPKKRASDLWVWSPAFPQHLWYSSVFMEVSVVSSFLSNSYLALCCHPHYNYFNQFGDVIWKTVMQINAQYSKNFILGKHYFIYMCLKHISCRKEEILVFQCVESHCNVSKCCSLFCIIKVKRPN